MNYNFYDLFKKNLLIGYLMSFIVGLVSYLNLFLFVDHLTTKFLILYINLFSFEKL